MARARVLQHAFNVGVQDKTALTRIDLARMRLAAEEQTNFIPRATGPAMVRPGLELLSTTASNAATRLKEFVFGATDAALLELSNNALRIRVSDTLVTRPSVSTAVTSGDFNASTGWTLTTTDGATAAITGGYLTFSAFARGSQATATQTLTIAGGDQNVEHALRIVVDRGPVAFRLGSSAGGDQYIAETTLRTGTHSLAFTPTGGSAYVQIISTERNIKRVDSINIEAAGAMSLPTPWAAANLGKIRMSQSADVVFCACAGVAPRRIERRSNRSWSVVLYSPNDGPFQAGRSAGVKLKPSVTTGNGTLTSDGPFFTTNHVGALFKLHHSKVDHSITLAGAAVYSDPIRVTGVANENSYNDRDWSYTITGTWSGTLRWYRSFDSAESGYKAFRKADGSSDTDITSNVSNVTNDDSDDNAVVYYKIGFDDSSYTSGAATVAINYDGDSGYGICRVVGYTSPTQVSIEVLTPFKAAVSTDEWQEGEWSAARIYPSSVALSDGRLWWSGEDRFWGSVSDAFESFDEEVEGDAGPINRSIATGGVNETQWLMPLQRILIGTEGAVSTAKSSSLDEPLTPGNITIKDSSTVGVAPLDPVRVDARGLCVERSGRDLMEITFDGSAGEYVVTQLSKLTTDLFASGVKEMAIQRRPDTRVWMVLNSGIAVCCLYEPAQEVLAFTPIETDGLIESVAVLPAIDQDRAYFVVNRTVGSTLRLVEKMARDDEAKPSTRCCVMDAFVRGTNSPASTTIALGSTMANRTVVVWADGAPLETSAGVPATFTANGSGNITVPSAVTAWVAGLAYRARYKSARLAFGADGAAPILQRQAVVRSGLLMTNFVRNGIKIGSEWGKMFPMPARVDGATPASMIVDAVVDEPLATFGGQWNMDSRVHIEVNAPYPATLLGMVLEVESNA